MNLIKKILLAIAALTIVFALSSCAGLFGDSGDNTPPTSDPTRYAQIIIESTDIDVLDVRNAVSDLMGMIPVMLYNDSVARDGEIVLGNSDRLVTKNAKATLESELAKSSKYDCGYIIYFDGKNIAVYWQLDDMNTIAISDFVKDWVEAKQLKLEAGAFKTGLYNRSEYENEKYWLSLEAVASPDVVQALKTLNSYYDGSQIVDWMANLYDPEIGAFYYSISARDNVGFLPDIESTTQITQLIVSSGAMKNRNDLPTEIKVKLLNFALGLQSANDGYFYHPQWPQDKDKLNTDRYGRDLSRALGIISDLNVDIDGDGIEDDIYPLYCAPNGTKCKLHKDGGSCIFPQTEIPVSDALGLAVSAAVSKVSDSYVKATASVSSHPDYSSREAFSAWLEAYNATIKENSGKAHNLSAISGEIRAHGYEDIVIAHLERVQAEVFEEQLAAGEEPTGLWQRSVDYNAVWGLLKYNSYFNSSNAKPMDLKYIPYIIKTCIKVIALPADGDYEANDIYNMWQAIQRVVNHVKSRYGTEEVNKIYEMLREDSASLIQNSILKLEPFKRSDGSFSYRTSGISPTTIYGTAIAMGVVEGDVNAVSLCVQMYEGVFTALGYSKIPLFTKSDGDRFVDTLLSSEPIRKNGTDNSVIDFEDGLIPNGVSASLKGPGSVAEIVDDPEGENGKVLHMHSMPIEGSGSDSITIKPYNLGGACYVVDMDMYFTSENNGDKYSFQFYYGDAYMIEFYLYSNDIAIYADKSGSGTAGDLIARVPYDTWFRFTGECYMPNDVNDIDSPVLRIWIDEELVCETDDFLDKNGNGTYTDSFQTVKLWSMKKKETNLYVDNCFIAIVPKEFDEGDEEFYDARNQ